MVQRYFFPILSLVIFTISTTISWNTFAQGRIVQFNYAQLTFDEGRPLPAQEELVITGAVPNAAYAVEIQLYTKKGEDKTLPIDVGYWKQPMDARAKTFRIPLDKKLRANNKYDFRISYYRDISETERLEARRKLVSALDAYIDQSIEVTKRKAKFTKRPKTIKEDLDLIVTESLLLYRNKSDLRFKGFSDLVVEQIEEMHNSKLYSGTGIFGDKNRDATKMQRYNELVNTLKKQIRAEIEYLFNADWMMVYDSRYIDDYRTGKGNGSLPLHIGYGVVSTEGVTDSMSYGHGPYVGVTIPFGNEAFVNKFWSNMTLNVGIFLNDFKEDGEKVTGPVIGRPIHAGLGYKLYQFINLNAGVTLLENASPGASDKVYIRPYVGLSARINLSMKLDK